MNTLPEYCRENAFWTYRYLKAMESKDAGPWTVLPILPLTYLCLLEISIDDMKEIPRQMLYSLQRRYLDIDLDLTIWKKDRRIRRTFTFGPINIRNYKKWKKEGTLRYCGGCRTLYLPPFPYPYIFRYTPNILQVSKWQSHVNPTQCVLYIPERGCSCYRKERKELDRTYKTNLEQEMSILVVCLLYSRYSYSTVLE
jgi:hypothetical protein